jgi:shikimate kinase
MKHVFLVGFMGAGKSTVGRVVAEKIGRPFVDLDARIEEASGRPVAKVFETQGEPVFRALETEALAALAEEPPSVVACGGGVVVRDANRAMLKSLGYVIFLRVSAGETLARVGDDGTRPLLSGAGGLLAATALLEARESLYTAVADATIDTAGRSAEEVALRVESQIAEVKA